MDAFFCFSADTIYMINQENQKLGMKFIPTNAQNAM